MMPLTTKINVALRKQICQKIGSERVKQGSIYMSDQLPLPGKHILKEDKSSSLQKRQYFLPVFSGPVHEYMFDDAATVFILYQSPRGRVELVVNCRQFLSVDFPQN